MDNKTLSLNVSEAFRKITYIIRLLFTNKLSESFKMYKLKSTSIIDMRVSKLLLFHQDNKLIKLNRGINEMIP